MAKEIKYGAEARRALEEGVPVFPSQGIRKAICQWY